MNFRHFAILVAIAILVTSCQEQTKKETQVNTKRKIDNGWRKLDCGLFIHKNGDIGYASKPSKAFTPREELQPEECPNAFITHFGFEDTTMLKNVIDTITFEPLVLNYYKDKNHIYSYFQMCSGGYFDIFSNDTTSFFHLGGDYIRYKSKIYNYKGQELKADVATFKVFKERGNFAKDKNGYFLHDERISEESLIKDHGFDKNQLKFLKAL